MLAIDLNCIVTAGPTYEPLDEVRRLINFSTGRLGTELSNHLSSRGHRVTLLRGHQATWSGPAQVHKVVEFTTTADLEARFRALAASPVDAVFHAAAVSDFSFGSVFRQLPNGRLEKVQAGKISSRAGPLLAELTATPKIIPQLRGFFRHALLVGWKYEMDGSREDAIAEAMDQISTCKTDACVANGRAYGSGFGLVTACGQCQHIESMTELFAALERLLDSAPRS